MEIQNHVYRPFAHICLKFKRFEILTTEEQYWFETKQRSGVKAFSSHGSITFNELAVSRFSLC